MTKKLGIMTALMAAAALLSAVACGGSGPPPLPTQPPATETPVKGPTPPEEPTTTEVPAPIEDTNLVPPASAGGEYTLKITSGLPSGCAQFNEYRVQLDGNTFLVEVTNLMPVDQMIACTAVYGYHEGEAALGSGLITGVTYTVSINGELTHSFIAR